MITGRDSIGHQAIIPGFDNFSNAHLEFVSTLLRLSRFDTRWLLIYSYVAKLHDSLMPWKSPISCSRPKYERRIGIVPAHLKRSDMIEYPG